MHNNKFNNIIIKLYNLTNNFNCLKFFWFVDGEQHSNGRASDSKLDLKCDSNANHNLLLPAKAINILGTFVFNLSSYEYYMSNDDPGQVTANSLILFLKDVATNIVLPKGGRLIFIKFYVYFLISLNIFSISF